MSCQRTAVVSAAFALVLSFASSAFAAAFAPVISDDFTYADQSWSTNGTSGDTGLGGGIGFSQNWQYQLGPNGLSSAAISSGELVLSTNSTGGAAAIFERDFASAISPGATTTRLSFSQQSNAGLAFAALRLRTGTTDRLRIGLQNNSGNPSAYSAWYAGTSVNISSFSTATRNWTVDFVWNEGGPGLHDIVVSDGLGNSHTFDDVAWAGDFDNVYISSSTVSNNATSQPITYDNFEIAIMVPEPSTAMLAILGLIGLAARRRRHK